MHKNIIDLKISEHISGETYLVGKPRVGVTKNGSSYFTCNLTDSSGVIDSTKWDMTPEEDININNSNYIEIIDGVVELNNKKEKRINIKRFKPANPDSNLIKFLIPTTKNNINEMAKEVGEYLKNIKDENLLSIARAYWNDKEFKQKFCYQPAASFHHHAFIGGLLQHTVSMMRTANLILQNNDYNYINKDVVMLGLFLHDSGKLFEIGNEPPFEYSLEGKLFGHLLLGYEEYKRRVNLINNKLWDSDKVKHVAHIIVSHHGKLEFDAIKVPITPEALLCHQIDVIDSTQNTMARMGDFGNKEGSDFVSNVKDLGNKDMWRRGR